MPCFVLRVAILDVMGETNHPPRVLQERRPDFVAVERAALAEQRVDIVGIAIVVRVQIA